MTEKQRKYFKEQYQVKIENGYKVINSTDKDQARSLLKEAYESIVKQVDDGDEIDNHSNIYRKATEYLEGEG